MSTISDKLITGLINNTKNTPESIHNALHKAFRLGVLVSSIENILTIEEIQEEIHKAQHGEHSMINILALSEDDLYNIDNWLTSKEGIQAYLSFYKDAVMITDESLDRYIEDYQKELIDYLVEEFIQIHPPF